MHKPWQEADVGWGGCDHIRQGSNNRCLLVPRPWSFTHHYFSILFHAPLEAACIGDTAKDFFGFGMAATKAVCPAQISKTIVHHGMGSYVSACSERPWFYQAWHGDGRISRALKSWLVGAKVECWWLVNGCWMFEDMTGVSSQEVS